MLDTTWCDHGIHAEVALPIRVYIEDTDAGGIVYYVNYLKYMERARTEFLRAHGLEQSQTMTQDIAFVVHTANVRFVRPAKLDDELSAICRLVTKRRASVVFHQEVRNVHTRELHCVGEVTVACVSRSTLRPRALPSPRFTPSASTGLITKKAL